jgi:hypothetical protein
MRWKSAYYIAGLNLTVNIFARFSSPNCSYCHHCLTLEVLRYNTNLHYTLVSYLCNRPWSPTELWDVEAPTCSRQSVHRWWWGCQPYAPATLYRTGRFLVLICVRDWVDPRAIVRPQGLGQFKDPRSSYGFDSATFRLVAQCPNRLR